MNECILVVDDDKEIVKAIAILLEKEGYRVLKAYNGMEALDCALDPTLRLIIIDVMMPQLDGIATIVLSLLTAVILTSDIKFKKFFRAVIYLPNVIAAIAVGYMWILYVFNNKFGLLTTLFSRLGLESLAAIQWTDQRHLFLAMSIAYVFCNVGYYMLIYVAAIEKIPADYYEAARIEGAGAARCFFSITLPLIKSVFATSLVLWTTRVMGFFELSLVFSDITTVTPMVYTYNALFGTCLLYTSPSPRDRG